MSQQKSSPSAYPWMLKLRILYSSEVSRATAFLPFALYIRLMNMQYVYPRSTMKIFSFSILERCCLRLKECSCSMLRGLM